MIEKPTLGKFAKWKRPLICGLLSALAGEVVLISLFAANEGYIDLNIFLYIIGVGFIVPVIIILGVNFDSIALPIIIIFLYWFSVGALLGKYTKKYFAAFAYWLLVIVASIIIAIPMSLFSP